MQRLRLGAFIVVGAALFGCPTTPPLPSDATGTTEDTASETGASTNGTSPSMTSAPASSTGTPTGSETSDPTDDTSATSGSSSSSTGPECVDGQLGAACDPFGDDCPDCAKCMPYDDDGGDTWNASACSPVVPSPGEVGQPCEVMGSVASGLDTCNHGAICWHVDPSALTGTCVALCSGTAESPFCESPVSVCLRAEGAMAVCVASCDPLLQNCEDGDGCYPGGVDTFACVPTSADASAFGESCDGFNVCAPGMFCAAAAAVPNCASACCSEFCDLGDPDASMNCAGAAGGQECVPWFAPGQAPPGFEDVGACAIP